jgi:NAD(P)-dependent dehydrogenase (short-subunit alcohol dehydrogenase family)
MVDGLQLQGDKTGPIAILGACGGIGRALTASLQEAGVSIVALDLADSLARHPPPVPAIAIDVLSEASIAEAMRELARSGKLSGFVNLAGYSRGVITLADTATDAFDDTLAGNLRGAFLACRAALPLMSSPGAMVLVSSGLAHYIRPGHGAYAAAKAGLIALAKTLAVESAPDIRVNVVAPGPVDTAFITGGTGRSDERQRPMIPVEEMAAAIPMRRIARVEDIVGPITFLLGPASAYMTGQVLWVNGGAYMP